VSRTNQIGARIAASAPACSDLSVLRPALEIADLSVMLFLFGGERGPVTFPAFKAGDAVLRGPGGGFDFHTPPPTYFRCNYLAANRSTVPIAGTDWSATFSIASRCDCGMAWV
jgi:hypothetical protein